MTISEFLTQLCEHCGIDTTEIQIETEETDDYQQLRLVVPENESGLLIGFHGETLESLQRIVRVIFQEEGDRKKIVLNVNQYREERAEKLADLAENIVHKVIESGRPYTFNSFLPAHERFIIHSTVGEMPEADQVETVSTGQQRDRKLTIRLKE